MAGSDRDDFQPVEVEGPSNDDRGRWGWDEFMSMGPTEGVWVGQPICLTAPQVSRYESEAKTQCRKTRTTLHRNLRSRVLRQLIGVANWLTTQHPADRAFKIARFSLKLPPQSTVDLVTNHLPQQELSEKWTIISSDPELVMDAAVGLGAAASLVTMSASNLAPGTWVQHRVRTDISGVVWVDFAVYPLPRSPDGSCHLLVKQQSVRVGTTKVKFNVSLAGLDSAEVLPLLGRAPKIERLATTHDKFRADTDFGHESQTREYKEVNDAEYLSAANIYRAIDNHMFPLVRGNSDDFVLYLGVCDKTCKPKALPLRDVPEHDYNDDADAAIMAMFEQFQEFMACAWEGNIFPGVPEGTTLQLQWHEVASVGPNEEVEDADPRFIVEVKFCWPASHTWSNSVAWRRSMTACRLRSPHWSADYSFILDDNQSGITDLSRFEAWLFTKAPAPALVSTTALQLYDHVFIWSELDDITRGGATSNQAVALNLSTFVGFESPDRNKSSATTLKGFLNTPTVFFLQANSEAQVLELMRRMAAEALGFSLLKKFDNLVFVPIVRDLKAAHPLVSALNKAGLPILDCLSPANLPISDHAGPTIPAALMSVAFFGTAAGIEPSVLTPAELQRGRSWVEMGNPLHLALAAKIVAPSTQVRVLERAITTFFVGSGSAGQFKRLVVWRQLPSTGSTTLLRCAAACAVACTPDIVVLDMSTLAAAQRPEALAALDQLGKGFGDVRKLLLLVDTANFDDSVLRRCMHANRAVLVLATTSSSQRTKNPAPHPVSPFVEVDYIPQLADLLRQLYPNSKKALDQLQSTVSVAGASLSMRHIHNFTTTAICNIESVPVTKWLAGCVKDGGFERLHKYAAFLTAFSQNFGFPLLSTELAYLFVDLEELFVGPLQVKKITAPSHLLRHGHSLTAGPRSVKTVRFWNHFLAYKFLEQQVGVPSSKLIFAEMTLALWHIFVELLLVFERLMPTCAPLLLEAVLVARNGGAFASLVDRFRQSGWTVLRDSITELFEKSKSAATLKKHHLLIVLSRAARKFRTSTPDHLSQGVRYAEDAVAVTEEIQPDFQLAAQNNLAEAYGAARQWKSCSSSFEAVLKDTSDTAERKRTIGQAYRVLRGGKKSREKWEGIATTNGVDLPQLEAQSQRPADVVVDLGGREERDDSLLLFWPPSLYPSPH